MVKKLLSILLFGVVIGLISVQATLAFDPDFDKKQNEAMTKLGIKPGDVINKDNADKVKDCLPPSVYDWVKKGEFTIFPATMKYDYSQDEAYTKSSMANKGKYAIGDKDQIIDKATGERPKYVQGTPFPEIDWKNDPQAGLKVLHNRDVDKGRPGSTWTDFDVCWVSDKGLDRYIYGDDIFFYFWNRPGGEIPNPQDCRRMEVTALYEPFDLAGSAMLYHYWADGSPERFVQYVPAIRRIKKMNVTDRSSPFFGTDFCNDDGAGYVGQPEAMNWKILDKVVMLMPMAEWCIDEPDKYEQLPNGTWKSGPAGRFKWGYDKEFANEKYNVAWMPWHARWIPREMYKISMKAKDPYYAYGDQILYVDAASGANIYKVVWDKSGAYWKTLMVCNDPQQWGPNRSMTMQIWYNNIDDKTHHCSICNCRGQRDKFYYQTYFNKPENNPGMYKDEVIATWGK
jgi:hypothetical protein